MIRTETLPSGLSLATERMEDARSVCIGFWVGTGSRDEDDRLTPAPSHFLEHLLFKGTAERSASAIAEAVDEVGGDFNAFTTKEYTSFYIRLLAEHLDLGLDILSDIMWRPALRPADLDAERQVILDEILMHADEPADEAAEQSSAALFPDHPLGREVLGTQESVAAMTAERIREFFDRHYRPGNMVAAVAGDLDHRRGGRRARAHGSRGRSGRRPPRTGRPPDDKVEPLAVTRRATEQAHLVLAARSVDRTDPRRYALAVLNHVLGGGLSSRLFQEIRERRGLAYSVWSERVAYHDAGIGQRGHGHRPRARGRGARHRRHRARRAGRPTGITERELTIAKGNLRAETLLACEDSGARMSRIGAGLLLHGEILTRRRGAGPGGGADPRGRPRRRRRAGGRTEDPVGGRARSTSPTSTPARSGWAEPRPGSRSRCAPAGGRR